MLKIKDDVDLKELEKFGFEDNNGIYKKMIEDGTEERDSIYKDYQDLGKEFYNSIPKKKIEDIVKFYKRQKIRLGIYIEGMNKKELSHSGKREKGYYEGNLSRIEDILDRLQDLLEDK